MLELHLNRNSYSSDARMHDTPKLPLEQRLNEFVVRILRVVDWERAAEKERQRAVAEAERERQRAAAEAETLKQAAIEEEIVLRTNDFRIRRLVETLPKWENVMRIRDFVQGVREEALERFGSIEESSQISRWLRWAEDYLNSIDPLAKDRELPTYSLTPTEIEELRRECESEWCSSSKTFRRQSS